MRAVSHYMVFEPVYPVPCGSSRRPASGEDVVVEHKPVQGEHAVGMSCASHCVIVVIGKLPPSPVKRAEQSLASLFKGGQIVLRVNVHLYRRVIVEGVPHQGQCAVPVAHRVRENVGDVRGDRNPAPVHPVPACHSEGHLAGVRNRGGEGRNGRRPGQIHIVGNVQIVIRIAGSVPCHRHTQLQTA